MKKVVVNGHGGTNIATDFSFQVNSGTPTKFLLDTDTLHGKNTLAKGAGTYNITEPAVTGYSTTYLNCDNVVLTNGATQTCEITNTDQSGTLIVNKVVVNDNGATMVATEFSFRVGSGNLTAFQQDNDTLHGKNTLTLNAGTYTITEPAVAGYTTTYDNCKGVVLTNSGSQTCTIVNDDEPKQPSGLSKQSWVLQDNVTFDIRPNGPDGTSRTHKVTFSLYAGCYDANGNGTPVCTPEAVDINKETGYASTVKGCLVGPTGGDTTYYWIASFEGDQYNKPAATTCGEEVTQIKAKDNSHSTLP